MVPHIFGAIEVNGKTIAVLGNGPDYIFPKENKEIYEKILEAEGLIISEYPEGVEPESEKFRKRNRIVSGLSIGILVVEAKKLSGTSITVRYAKEQGKDVFCIPSSIDNVKGVGTNNLIKRGAILVTEPSEIIEKYNGKKIKQLTIEDIEKPNSISLSDLENIKEEYREIYKELYIPLNVNEINAKTKIDIKEIYNRIFMMEVEGLIEFKENKYRIRGK